MGYCNIATDSRNFKRKRIEFTWWWPIIPTIYGVYEYQLLLLSRLSVPWSGTKGWPPSCWERTTHCLSPHFFSLNVINRNQNKADHCPREHLNVSHKPIPPSKSPFPFGWASFINSHPSAWILSCIILTSCNTCAWKSVTPFVLVSLNSATISLPNNSFTFVHARINFFQQGFDAFYCLLLLPVFPLFAAC